MTKKIPNTTKYPQCTLCKECCGVLKQCWAYRLVIIDYVINNFSSLVSCYAVKVPHELLILR